MNKSMEKFILKRLEENKNFFTKNEYKKLMKNFSLIKKVYIISMIDSYQNKFLNDQLKAIQ